MSLDRTSFEIMPSKTLFSVTWANYKGCTGFLVIKMTKEGVSTNSKTCCSPSTFALSSLDASKYCKSSTIDPSI